jgi:hypothetical protein
MSLSDDKKSVFDKIRAFTSIKNEVKLPDTTNIMTSINNKKEPIPFLIDVLKVIAGTEVVQELIGKLFTNLLDEVEPKLKTGLNKQLVQSNAGNNLPTKFSQGYSIPLKTLDTYGKFKPNSNSTSGTEVNNLLFDNTVPNFDNTMRNAIVNSGTDTVFSNLVINYNANTDYVTLKPNSAVVDSTTTIGSWFGDFVNDAVIVNKKEFLTNTMNAVYGSITANQNKTVEQVFQEQQINKLLQQVAEDNDSFEISQDDLFALQAQAQALIDNTVYYNMGCGMIGADLPLSGMTDFVTKTSGLTDPFKMGNYVADTVTTSTNATPEVAAQNKTSIMDGFLQRLINALTQTLVQSVTTTPQIRALLAIMSAFENDGNVQLDNPQTDMKDMKVFISCLIKKVVIPMIVEFIFKLAISKLIDLLEPIILKIVMERIKTYVNIIKSLSIVSKVL